MPRPGLRSKAQAMKRVKTPGARNTTHYWRKKPQNAHCAICKKNIQSIPRLRPSKMRKTPLISRKANRTESGRYCAKCLQLLIKKSIWQ